MHWNLTASNNRDSIGVVCNIHVFYYIILVTWVRSDMHWNLTASNNRDSISF